MADFNGRFGKVPRSAFDAHRALISDENIELVLTSRVARRATKVLTVQYDRVIYMLDDTAENRALIPQGRRPSIEAAKAALASLDNQPPAMLKASLQDQVPRLSALDEQIARSEQRILE